MNSPHQRRPLPHRRPFDRYCKTLILAPFLRERTTAIRGMRVVPPYVHVMTLPPARAGMAAWPSPAPVIPPVSAKRLHDGTGFSEAPGVRRCRGRRRLLSPSGRNVGQPDHVLVETIAGDKAERRPGAGEEGRAVAEHDRVEVQLILIDKAKIGQASRQV